MNIQFRSILSALVVTAVVGIASGVGSQASWANTNAQNPHTRQDPGQPGDQEGCHNMTPEPGWMILLIAGAAPAALKLRRRRAC